MSHNKFDNRLLISMHTVLIEALRQTYEINIVIMNYQLRSSMTGHKLQCVWGKQNCKVQPVNIYRVVDNYFEIIPAVFHWSLFCEFYIDLLSPFPLAHC